MPIYEYLLLRFETDWGFTICKKKVQRCEKIDETAELLAVFIVLIILDMSAQFSAQCLTKFNKQDNKLLTVYKVITIVKNN